MKELRILEQRVLDMQYCEMQIKQAVMAEINRVKLLRESATPK